MVREDSGRKLGRTTYSSSQYLEPLIPHSPFKAEALGLPWLVVQWLRLQAPNAGGLGSVPDQITRSHMLQLRLHTSQLKETVGHN